MAKSKADLSVLEQSRVALENATQNSKIAQLLGEVGYGSEKIDEGKVLQQAAVDQYNLNKKEDAEASISYDNFKSKYNELKPLYRKHRKRAKIVFMESPSELIILDIVKAIPINYLDWMQSVEQFYTAAINTDTIAQALATLKVTQEDLTMATVLLGEVKTLRQTYLNEEGESQNATKEKDKAFSKLDKWMRSFFSIAGIALEDHPQLLESLGKNVKS